MIALDGLERGQGAVRDGAHETHHVKRGFGQVDLAAEQRDARPVLLRLMKELETIARRARAAAQDADHQIRVERRQLLQGFWPVIGDLEESRPLRLGEACEAMDDGVVDELRHRFRGQPSFDIRIEHLEKIRKSVGFGVGAKVRERLERGMVSVDVVGEGDRVKPKIGQRLHMLERCAAERPRRLEMMGAAAMAPNVCRVVGADRRLDPGAREDVALDELFQIRDRSQHDVDDVLLDDRLDRIKELGARLKTRFVRPRRPDCMQPRTHIGILGVGDDEIRTPVGAAVDACELVVEPGQCDASAGLRSECGLIARAGARAPWRARPGRRGQRDAADRDRNRARRASR